MKKIILVISYLLIVVGCIAGFGFNLWSESSLIFATAAGFAFISFFVKKPQLENSQHIHKI